MFVVDRLKFCDKSGNESFPPKALRATIKANLDSPKIKRMVMRVYNPAGGF